MKPHKLMSHFEELAERLEIKLIRDTGDFEGGPCIINNERVIVINKRKPVEQRLRTLAQGFQQVNLAESYVVPVLRDYIERVAGNVPESVEWESSSTPNPTETADG